MEQLGTWLYYACNGAILVAELWALALLVWVMFSVTRDIIQGKY